MKNKLFLNSTIILALLFFSCAGESKDENISFTETEPKNNIDVGSKEIFTELENPNTEFTSEQLEAFQLRAIQKFQDFTDFIKMISDNKIDKDLREHSIQLSTELFISDSILITDSSLINKSESIVTLINFLKRIKPRSKPITAKTSLIEFIQPLTKDSSNFYTGVMDAVILIKGKNKNINIDVKVVEIQKEFGDSSQTTMDVRLGNIY
jgi:hypothetical protein